MCEKCTISCQEIRAFPTSLLAVKILQARNITVDDLSSGADCYVTLWLPTASKEKLRTRTVLHSSVPVWNETFYFMIQNQVKNILELRIYAEDSLIEDDLLFTILFDVAEVAPGERVHVTFILNLERMKELEVEFTLKENLDHLERLITNDVLVSRSVSCLNVCVAKGKSKRYSKEEDNFALQVKGSYEDRWKTALESGLIECFHFHYPTYWEPELNVILQHCSSNGEQDKHSSFASLTMPLKLLSAGHEVKVALPVSEDTNLDLTLHTQSCSEQLDMRLGFDLCEEEKSFLHKRKNVVSAALKSILQLKKDLLDNEVPVVAVMAAGGGCRAMTSLYGHLSGLKKLGILDCITYIGGTSGSSWTMSNLYKDSAWSQKDLGRPICKAKKHMTKNKINVFSLEHLINYQKEMTQRAEDDISTSFNDLWALALENILHALWSNILAVNLLDVWNCLSSTDESWQKLIQSKIRNIEQNYVPPKSSNYLGTSWMCPDGMLFKIIRNVLTDCPLHHHIHNFLKGLQMHKDYYQDSQFSVWKDSRLDQFPNQLTPSEDDICLVDAAYFINTSCPPLLRKERKVDVILSFDYTPDNPFQSIDQTQKYCLEQGIPFPRILLSTEDMKNPRECYLFVDEENRKAPIVLHFPLVNDTFQKFQEPGVERGQYERTVPLSGHCSPYHLMNFRYSEKDFDALLKLTDYNIRNNRDKILEAFSLAIEWKKCQAIKSVPRHPNLLKFLLCSPLLPSGYLASMSIYNVNC